MPVALRSVATAATTAPAQTITVPKPAGLANGDLLLLALGRFNEDGSSLTVTWSCPGFTPPAGASLESASSRGAALLYKHVTDATSEPSSYTVTATPSNALSTLNIAGGAVAWTGVDASTPFDAPAAIQGQTSTSVVAPSIATVTADAMLIFFGISRRAVTFTPPTGMTEAWDVASSGGTAGNLVAAELAHEQLSTAGATGTRTATISGGTARENLGVLLALRPQSEAPTGLTTRVHIGGAWQSGDVRQIA